MPDNTERTVELPLGIVLRRQPGATRWARWVWRAVAVLPGAGPADWRELRRDGETVEYHAATLPVVLHRTDTEAYRVALSTEPPSVWVVMRETADADAPYDYDVFAVTASPFEAQDFQDGGDDIVEAIPMPPALIGWVSEFIERHHTDEAFVKRRRDRVRTDRVEDGKGDARIAQDGDVYRSPASIRRRKLQ